MKARLVNEYSATSFAQTNDVLNVARETVLPNNKMSSRNRTSAIKRSNARSICGAKLWCERPNSEVISMLRLWCSEGEFFVFILG